MLRHQSKMSSFIVRAPILKKWPFYSAAVINTPILRQRGFDILRILVCLA